MIYLYNSLGHKKQEFSPIEQEKAKMYVCGPTVYAEAHLGNLRAYIFEDILRRVLEFNGLKVYEVMNITDVGHLTSDEDSGEDKMAVGAKRENLSVWRVAEKYTQSFKDDIAKLNIEPPQVWAKATDHIPEQIDFIKKIEAKGFTYKTDDGVYFNTAKLKDYGRLANIKVNEQQTGTRVEENKAKKNPADFALWKFSKKGEQRQMEWPSPWGKGFPGWHIECSAMSKKYLGEEFDIHTGGLDHLAVHHTNEIAQSEAVSGKVPARYWLHGAFLLQEGRKMAKSAGDILTLGALAKKGIEPLAFRYLALTAHYRRPLNFTWDGIAAAQNTLKSIRKLRETSNELKGEDRAKLKEKITAALNNDLDTPKALSLLHQANDFELWLEFEPVLALNLDQSAEIPADIIKLSQERQAARKSNDYDKADALRLKIEEKGYMIEDTAAEPKISRK